MVRPCAQQASLFSLLPSRRQGALLIRRGPRRQARATFSGADTPRTTVAGNTFIAPAEWKIDVRGAADDTRSTRRWIAHRAGGCAAADANAAVAAAWAAYPAAGTWPLKVTHDFPDKDGWSNIRDYNYQTSPNEKRGVFANTRRAGDVWTVMLYDMDEAVGERRAAQVALIFSRLLPKGYTRETFAGKQAHALDEARIAELRKFVERGRQQLGVPGVSIGVVQDGKTVFAGGFGLRELGRISKPDADTLYMIASNTKAMTTLMLG